MTESFLRTEHAFSIMGGPATLCLEHKPEQRSEAEDALKAVVDVLTGLEQRYSRYVDDSLISRINDAAGLGEPIAIDAETHALLEFCDRLWLATGGLFDPTAGVLREVWDFRQGTRGDIASLPSLLARVGWNWVQITETDVALARPGMELDFGGIAKEYAADTAARVLRDRGFDHGLVELAGDVVVIGTTGAQRPWQVGIRNPQQPQDTLLSLALTDAAVATSGNYARRMEIDGVSYSHLLDPRTGYPVPGPASVSVIADSCLIAGAIATVACLKSPDEAASWLEDSGLPWLMVGNGGELSGPIQAQLAAAQAPDHRTD